MKTNVRRAPVHTHEGAVASQVSPYERLRRAICACLLWESQFYESGTSIAVRIVDLVGEVKPEQVRSLAIEARTSMKLRHAPLLLLAALAERRTLDRGTVASVIQRPDECGELLSIWFAGKKRAIPNSIRRGICDALPKFDEYALAKWSSSKAAIKLRDVFRLCRPKPPADRAALWGRVVRGELETPDTWEVALSGGADKKEAFTRLIAEGKLYALALLRNLRNMVESGVDRSLIESALASMKVERVLPFRFIAAARYAPSLEPAIERAMFRCVETVEKLHGSTIVLVDVSGSMNDPLGGKSDMTRIDAACGLAILVREICPHARVFTFSEALVEVPARRGFALRDAIKASQPHAGTLMGAAVAAMPKADRLIVVTDEQSQDVVSPPLDIRKRYIVNVASYENGVAYGPFHHVNGWSESIVDYIRAFEQESSARPLDDQAASR